MCQIYCAIYHCWPPFIYKPTYLHATNTSINLVFSFTLIHFISNQPQNMAPTVPDTERVHSKYLWTINEFFLLSSQYQLPRILKFWHNGIFFPIHESSIYGAPGHRVTALCGNSGTSGSCHLKAPPMSVFPSYYNYRQQKGKETMEKAPLFFTAKPRNDITYAHLPLVRTTPQGYTSVQRVLGKRVSSWPATSQWWLNTVEAGAPIVVDT